MDAGEGALVLKVEKGAERRKSADTSSDCNKRSRATRKNWGKPEQNSGPIEKGNVNWGRNSGIEDGASSPVVTSGCEIRAIHVVGEGEENRRSKQRTKKGVITADGGRGNVTRNG